MWPNEIQDFLDYSFTNSIKGEFQKPDNLHIAPTFLIQGWPKVMVINDLLGRLQRDQVQVAKNNIVTVHLTEWVTIKA